MFSFVLERGVYPGGVLTVFLSIHAHEEISLAFGAGKVLEHEFSLFFVVVDHHGSGSYFYELTVCVLTRFHF